MPPPRASRLCGCRHAAARSGRWHINWCRDQLSGDLNRQLKRPGDHDSGVQVTCDVGYTSVPILVFLGLSVLDLGPMYATDRQTASSLNDKLSPYGAIEIRLCPRPRGRGHNRISIAPYGDNFRGAEVRFVTGLVINNTV